MKYFGGGGTTAATPVLTPEEQAKPWLVPQGTAVPTPSPTPPPSLISGGEQVSPDEQALLDALALKRRNQRVVGDIRSVGLSREPVPR
jgi:hypothetical protein